MATPSREEITALVERYVAALDAQDTEAAVECFAPWAVQEDPVGDGTNTGPEAIRGFFEQTFSVGFDATLDGPVTVRGRWAGFRILIEVPAGRTPFRVLVTDLVEVDDDLLFRSLRAVPDSKLLNP